MEKIDLKKKYKELYAPKHKIFSIVEVPQLNYITIEGEGDPNTSESFMKATEALYTTAYGIKFAAKEKGEDFTVMPLEGLWWCDDMNKFSEDDKNEWKWKLMILLPEVVTQEMADEAKAKGLKKKPLLGEVLQSIKVEKIEEGVAVQTLYVGAYKDEAPVIAEMHAYIEKCGYEKNGLHHEIYLGDPRKTEPSKLKTILRQPVKRKEK